MIMNYKRNGLAPCLFFMMLSLVECDERLALDTEPEFKVVDTDTLPSGYIQVMLQARDTNWVQMETHSKSIVDANSKIVAVAFTHGTSAKYKGNHALQNPEEITAVYKASESSKGFDFIKFPFGVSE